MITQQALLTLTSSNTAYSFAIPGNASNLRFRNREATETIEYSFDNFTHFSTLPAPAAATPSTWLYFNNYRCSPNGQTIYFKDVANSGKNMEIEYELDG